MPDYEIDRKLWLNEHFEGGYLFRQRPGAGDGAPVSDDKPWKVKFSWQDAGYSLADTGLTPTQLATGAVEARALDSVSADANGKLQPTRPGVRGTLRFVIEAWNPGAD